MQYERVLGELVGEVILNTPARSAPQVLRPTVRAGLELLDASLHPSYVIRQTENLTFADAFVLHRSVEIEVAGDELDVGEKGWLPLVALPRPLDVPVDAYDANGDVLPRPRGSEVRSALSAALMHLARELLMAGESWTAKPDETPDEERLVSQEDIAQWTLQSAVGAVCTSGPGGPHNAQRRALLNRRLRRLGTLRTAVQVHRGRLDPLPVDDLRRIAAAEEVPENARALDLLLGPVADDGAFLQLLDFVYRKQLVITTIEPGHQDRRLRVDLPDIVASPYSRHRQLVRGALRFLEVGDHNFTARVKVPVPRRIEQYRLQVHGSADGDGGGDPALGVVAAVRGEPDPVMAIVETMAACRSLICDAASTFGQGTVDVSGTRRRLAVLVHATAEGRTAMARMSSAAEVAFSGTRDVLSRWSLGGARTRRRGFPYRDDRPRRFRRGVAEAERLLRRVEGRAQRADAALDVPVPASPGKRTTRRARVRGRARARDARATLAALPGEAVQAAEALGRLRDWAGELDVHLTCEDSPGAATARVVVGQQPSERELTGAGEVTLDVWAALVDQASRYGRTVFAVPIGTILLLGGFGFLIFEVPDWLWDYPVAAHDGPDGALDRQADALAAVMLLIPGFVASQLRRTTTSSVIGWLRRAPRLQSYTAVLASAVCAMFVAADMGTQSDAGDVSRVLWAFRASVGIFVSWCVWAALACLRRWSTQWEPKGMQRALVGRRRRLRVKRYRLRRWRRGHESEYGHPPWDRLRWLFLSRQPDVVFDLSEAPPASVVATARQGRGR